MTSLFASGPAEGPAFGYGTYGSRSLAVGGMAVRTTALTIVAKAQQIAGATKVDNQLEIVAN